IFCFFSSKDSTTTPERIGLEILYNPPFPAIEAISLSSIRVKLFFNKSFIVPIVVLGPKISDLKLIPMTQGKLFRLGVYFIDIFQYIFPTSLICRRSDEHVRHHFPCFRSEERRVGKESKSRRTRQVA